MPDGSLSVQQQLAKAVFTVAIEQRCKGSTHRIWGRHGSDAAISGRVQPASRLPVPCAPQLQHIPARHRSRVWLWRRGGWPAGEPYHVSCMRSPVSSAQSSQLRTRHRQGLKSRGSCCAAGAAVQQSTRGASTVTPHAGLTPLVSSSAGCGYRGQSAVAKGHRVAAGHAAVRTRLHRLATDWWQPQHPRHRCRRPGKTMLRVKCAHCCATTCQWSQQGGKVLAIWASRVDAALCCSLHGPVGCR